MQLPTLLLRNKSKAHKNDFGHVLVLAGSKRMLGAGALTALAALRSGAGLVTWGIPKSLNSTAHKKASHCVMTFPLPETNEQSLSLQAFNQIKREWDKYTVIALGPGLSQNIQTQQLIARLIKESPIPLILDADALNALNKNLSILKKSKSAVILTPHPGEMARLLGKSKSAIATQRSKIAKQFTRRNQCTLLLKGHQTVVASANQRLYINKTGNAGMATAGSGDVLTGIIAAFIAQGLTPYNATKYGAYIHGKAGDIAAKRRGKTSLIAADLIENIGQAIR